MACLIKSAMAGARSGKVLLAAKSVTAMQKSDIMGKAMRGNIERPPKPKPYDYENKFYTFWTYISETTSNRFDENTAMIVVEGPIGVGKDKFAKELAEELDMKYYPEPSMDYYYINDYGYNMRELDPKLPENTRSYDHVNFCMDPNDPKAGGYQLMMYAARLSQHFDATTHILNTGQGVVLQRSPHSDFVFMEAMLAAGFMTKNAKQYYSEIKANTIQEIVRPHLIIYLDIPVSEVQERVKTRGLPYEKDSKVFSDLYLSTMESQYKQVYLPELEKHSELLVYDWTGGGETDIVVEDIERIDFDKYRFQDKKLADWRMYREKDWSQMRQVYTNEKCRIMNYLNVPFLDAPECLMVGNIQEWSDVWYNAPGMKYDYGYNKELGDTGFLFKGLPKKYLKVL